jgi:sugar phosphate isomerase/epimerase
MSNISDRIAVCSWSLRAHSPQELAQSALSVGINKVQLALDPLRAEPHIWGNGGKILADSGISIVSGMFGCVGEDYSSLESIRHTGGVGRDETWAANWGNIRRHVPIAAALGLKLVTFHAGFIPRDASDPMFSKIRARIIGIADAFGEFGVELGFETGQEDAETLKHFLQTLGRPNVGVNFDPANMLLYGSGDPIFALRTLAPHLKQIHIKDAKRATVAGAWGKETVVGDGEVDWQRFFDVLREVNYRGHLVIEREGGNDRIADVKRAKELVVRAAR